MNRRGTPTIIEEVLLELEELEEVVLELVERGLLERVSAYPSWPGETRYRPTPFGVAYAARMRT